LTNDYDNQNVVFASQAYNPLFVDQDVQKEDDNEYFTDNYTNDIDNNQYNE